MIRGRLAVIAASAALSAATSCRDPVTPASGTPTLDDPRGGDVVAVTVGREHTCALNAAGVAYCWGSNEFGQVGVGVGTTACARQDRWIPCEPLPQAVGGGLRFQRIAAGGTHTCGVAQSGGIYCWGDNQYGQLGDPAVAVASAPTAALSASLYADVVTGDAHTCGLRTDGAAVCWGANGLGQLGVASAGFGSAIPALVQTNLRFASLSAGKKRTCGRISDGTTYCWGSIWVLRAVDGTEVTRPQSQPARVQPAPAFRQLSVGGQTTCAIALDGAAWCWESNSSGAMGDGTTTGKTSPRSVSTELRFTVISVGSQSTCAVTDAADLYCWGSGQSGQLGVWSGSLLKRCGQLSNPCALNPNRTSGWRAYSTVAGGQGDHFCGLTVSGSVYCWGVGSMGQRGDGTAGEQWWPTRVPLP